MSGAEWSNSFTAAAKQGMSGFRATVEAEAAAAAAAAEKAISAAAAKLEAARKREADATGQVRIAETKLQEVRAKGNATASQLAVAEERLAKAQRDLGVASGSTAAREGELTVAEKAQGDAAALASEKTATAGLRMREFGAAAQSGFGKAATAAKGASKMMLGFGMFGLADFGYHSLKAAGDFQASMNLLVTAGGESKTALNLVAAGVKSIATQTGTSTTDLANGMYILEKAGLRGANGLLVLRAAAQGARAENVDLGTMTNALTSIMRSYNLPASDAVKVTNQLVAASGASKTTMQEFAGSLSTVLPIASAAHLSFAQVGGAIATLTGHGTSAMEATQELANTIRNLQAPNRVAINEMAQFGLNSNDVSQKLGKRGLTGTIELLSQSILTRMGPSGLVLLRTFNASKIAAQDAATMFSHLGPGAQTLAAGWDKGTVSLAEWRKGLKALPGPQAALASQWVTMQNKSRGFNSELRAGGQPAQTYMAALKQMTGGSTGLNTALQLSGGSASTFKRNVDAVGKAGLNAGKNVSTWAITQKNFNVVLGKFREQIQVAAINVGTKLIPVLMAGFTWVQKNWTQVKIFSGVLLGLFGVLKGYTIIKGVVTAWKAWRDAQWGLNAAMNANVFGLIVIAIAALVVGVIYAYTHFKTFRTVVKDVFGFVKNIALDVAHWFAGPFVGFFTGTWAKIKGATSAFVGFFTHTLPAGFTAAWHAVSGAFSTAWSTVTGWLGKIRSAIVGFFVAVNAPFVGFEKFVGGIFSTIFHILLGMAKAGLGLIRDFINREVRGWVNIFNWVKDAISAVWTAAWAEVQKILGPPLKWIENTINTAWHGVLAAFNWVKSVVVSAWNSLWATVKAIIIPPLNWIRAFVQQVWRGLQIDFNWVKSTVVSIWNDLWATVKNAISPPLKAIRSALDTAIRGFRDAFAWGVNAIGTVWNGLKAIAEAPIKFLVDVVYLKGLKPLLDSLDRTFDAGHHLAPPVKAFARGDIVNRPTLGVFGEAGPEMIVPLSKPQRARELIAQSGLFPKFGAGGIFGDIAGAVKGAATGAFDWTKSIISQGAQILADPLGMLQKLASPILSKMDQFGGTQYGKLIEQIPHQLVSEIGGWLKQIVSSFVGGGGGNGGSIVAEARKFLGVPYLWGGTTPSGFDCSGFTEYVLKQVGISAPRTAAQQQSWAHGISGAMAQGGDLAFFGTPAHHVGIYEGAGKMIDAPHTGANVREEAVWGEAHGFGRVPGIVAGMIGAASAGGGAIRQLGQQIAASMGFGGQFPAIDYIFSHESGWNPNAQNPTSSAYGIPQFLDSTWAGYGGKTADPSRQIIDGIRYMTSRYGSPNGAESFWEKNHWYDTGGYLPPGPSMVYNGTGKPEPVLTDRQWDVIANRQTAPVQGNTTNVFNVRETDLTERTLPRLLHRAELVQRYGRPG